MGRIGYWLGTRSAKEDYNKVLSNVMNINLYSGAKIGYNSADQDFALRFAVHMDPSVYARYNYTDECWEIVNNQESGNTQQDVGTLLSQISTDDYGKKINYSTLVSHPNWKVKLKLDDWKVFYKDENNVYIILSEYLQEGVAPTSSGITKTGVYVNSSSVQTLKNYLLNTNTWKEFSSGVSGASAQGAPTLEQFKISSGLNIVSNGTISNTDKNYPLYVSSEPYWLATEGEDPNNKMYYITNAGGVYNFGYASSTKNAMRPVVCLPTIIKGTVGEKVILKK